MDNVRSALRQGRPSTTDLIPGTVLRHFLYKSKGNVQFVMPAYEPEYGTLLARRRSVIGQYDRFSVEGADVKQAPITIPHASRSPSREELAHQGPALHQYHRCIPLLDDPNVRTLLRSRPKREP